MLSPHTVHTLVQTARTEQELRDQHVTPAARTRPLLGGIGRMRRLAPRRLHLPALPMPRKPAVGPR